MGADAPLAEPQVPDAGTRERRELEPRPEAPAVQLRGHGDLGLVAAMPRDQPRIPARKLALDQQRAVLHAHPPRLGMRSDGLERDGQLPVGRRMRPHAQHPGPKRCQPLFRFAAEPKRCQPLFRFAAEPKRCQPLFRFEGPGARAGRGQVGEGDLAFLLARVLRGGAERHAQGLRARAAQHQLAAETAARDQEPAPFDDLGAHRQQPASPQAVQAIVMSV